MKVNLLLRMCLENESHLKTAVKTSVGCIMQQEVYVIRAERTHGALNTSNITSSQHPLPYIHKQKINIAHYNS